MIKKATKEMSMPKIILDGMPGMGKTATMLRLLNGFRLFLKERFPDDQPPDICIIDTEYRRSAQYQGKNRFSDYEYDFFINDIYDGDVPDKIDDMLVRGTHSPLAIIHKIRETYKYPNIRLLGIDSVSQAWDQVIQRTIEVEITEKRYTSFSSWGHQESKPLWKKMIMEFLSYNGASVMTMRDKIKYGQINVDGKTKIVQKGAEPIANSETKYDGTMILSSTDYCGTFEITKDNSGMGLTNQIIEFPDEEFAYKIMDYLFESNNGNNPFAPVVVDNKELAKIRHAIASNEDRIRSDRDLCNAFENHLSLDTYKSCIDVKSMQDAMSAVKKVLIKRKKDES